MKTVKIGRHYWATEDLNVTKFRNAEDIPLVEDSREWAQIDSAAYCITPGGNYLYNWHAVNDARGLAPEGFSIPTDAEWTELTDYLGGYLIAGNELKSTDWNGTNSSGFSASLGGYRNCYGDFGYFGTYGFWWSSSQTGSDAWYRYLCSYFSFIYRISYSLRSGFSVRCIKTKPK